MPGLQLKDGAGQRDGRSRSEGFVTSIYASPTMGRRFALGFVERGLSRLGETVTLVHPGFSEVQA